MSTLEMLVIPQFERLDEIRVYFENTEPGKGYITVICWGNAWTTYFGSMGKSSLQEFVARVDTCYLVNRMGITPHLKQRKVDHSYLASVIEAIKAKLIAGGL